jgi:capsular polysaccharide transport system permease protein
MSTATPARKRRLPRINRLFLLTVVLPTVLVSLYYGLIASDIYISESRFVIRSPQKPAVTGLTAILQGTGISRSADDTYTVQDYILSRDALGRLDKTLDLRSNYALGDWLSRFPALDFDDSFEALHRYYLKRTTLQVDSLSSITTLRVSAFTAAEALAVNRMLLQLSEDLVNRLNERARADAIRYAQGEVTLAEARARRAALAVSAYRNAKDVFDPERQSALQLQQVTELQAALMQARAQLVQVRQLAPQNPQIPVLEQQVRSLQAEISQTSASVTGGRQSLAGRSAEFQRLALEREFADRQLTTVLASLEQARNDAQRKQLYLDRIVQPNQPDMAVEPRRLRAVLAVLVMGLITWGVLSMLIAGIREHQD